MINKELLDILVCPKCKKSIKLSADENSLICTTCKLSYEIKNDTPILLIDHATKLTDEK